MYDIIKQGGIGYDRLPILVWHFQTKDRSVRNDEMTD